eukprot:scaffold20755_cov136-Isochrysis_galbana.AAC.5
MRRTQASPPGHLRFLGRRPLFMLLLHPWPLADVDGRCRSHSRSECGFNPAHGCRARVSPLFFLWLTFVRVSRFSILGQLQFMRCRFVGSRLNSIRFPDAIDFAPFVHRPSLYYISTGHTQTSRVCAHVAVCIYTPPSAKLSATRCSAMEATGETAPLGPALGSGGLGLG